jgi:hypothetical protein
MQPTASPLVGIDVSIEAFVANRRQAVDFEAAADLFRAPLLFSLASANAHVSADTRRPLRLSWRLIVDLPRTSMRAISL